MQLKRLKFGNVGLVWPPANVKYCHQLPWLFSALLKDTFAAGRHIYCSNNLFFFFCKSVLLFQNRFFLKQTSKNKTKKLQFLSCYN